MNAYELADELQKHGLNGDNYGLFNKRIQNMLRQQADRIAELEKDGKVCATCGGLVYDPVIKQTKPLSDEEMKELINNFPIIFSPQDLLSFARAIEERHGIK